MSYIEANLKLLAAKQPELARQLETAGCPSIHIAESASGLPTASVERNSRSTALHSRYNPLREAQQQIKKQDYSGADYFILLGFGLGYLLDATVEQYQHLSNHYFVVEADLEILRAAFEARDLTKILSENEVYFAWPASGPALADQWRKHFDPVLAQKSVFLTHLPSAALNPDLYKAAAETIQSQIYQTFTDINTLVADSQTFLNNFVSNLPKAIKAPGVAAFAGKFSQTPAVIVSAGPSLDKNIYELRGWEDHVLILATDTSVKPLLAAGIEPHFILTGDPALANYLHLKGAHLDKALLIAEATAYPSVFDEFEGRTLACTYDQSSLKSLADLLANKGVLKAWGSVATMVLDFALLLGCNPITFIGQDLAHTDGRIYCSGVYFEQEWFRGVTTPEEYQAQLVRLRSQRRTTMAEDIFGRPIESTDKLMAYRNWIAKVIEDHAEVKFINATEGGILRGNLDVISLKEALYRYCEKPQDLSTRIRTLFSQDVKDEIGRIKAEISAMMREYRLIQKTVEEGISVVQTSTGDTPSALKQKLESVTSAINSHRKLSPLVNSFNQMGNVTFLRKRHSLSRNPGTIIDQLSGLKDAYGEYFSSVRNALNIIGDALSQIHTAIPGLTPENRASKDR